MKIKKEHSSTFKTNIRFNPDYTAPDHKEGRAVWNSTDDTLDLQNADGSVTQVGQEQHLIVYNDSGTQIDNGHVVYISGATSSRPTVELAKADVHTTADRIIGIATVNIPNGSEGRVTTFGKVRGVDTSGMSPGDPIYLSATTAGHFTITKPVFSNFIIELGAVILSDATDGELFVNVIGDIEDIVNNAFNGQFLEGFDFTVTSNGTTVTGNLERKGGGDLTMNFSDGFTILDCTPAQTITLTSGTTSVPQTNYIYVDKSDKTLKVSTSEWLTTEHIKVAEVVLLDVSQTQTIGALRNQNWNDHIAETNNMGHILAINERIRQEPSRWSSGAEVTVSIVSASSPDDVYVANTSGVVYQMHKQTFPAMDMATGDDIHVVNNPSTPYVRRTNLNQLTVDSTGATLTNRYFSVVIWGIQNSGSEPSHVMLNLPSGSYLSSANAIADANNYSNYTIPTQFSGVGFLMARLTFNISSAGGGTWTLIENKDLRGFSPNTAAGGSGGGGTGVSSFTALTDTPSSYASQAGKTVRVNTGETALEFVQSLTPTQITDLTDAGDSTLHYHATDRDRANHTGTQLASTISDFDTEVSNNTDVSANTSARHSAVTVTDTAEIDLTLTGQDIQASIVAGSIDETKLDTSVNASLDLADSASQPGHTHTASDITDFDTEVSNNASVSANTAKVSADGSIDTHSDVDITTDPVAKNDVLMYNGTTFVPVPEGTTFTFSINSFTDNQSSIQEIGSGVWKAIGEISFSATYTNGPATNAFVSHSGWSNLTMTNSFEGPTTNTEAKNYPASVSTYTWTLNATDGTDNDTQNVSVTFYNRRFWGTSTTSSSYTEADIEGLASNELSNSRSKTFTVTAGASDYIIYSYPSRLGTATFTVGGFEGGFESPETVSVTNASGYTENYYVYRSTNTNLGTTTVVVT